MKRKIYTYIALLLCLAPGLGYRGESISDTKLKSSFNKDGKISYIKSGKSTGSTFVLLPGIGETKEGYKLLMEELSILGSVYSLDLRGQGESSIEFDNFSALTVAQDTIDFLDEIKSKNKFNKVILVGSSLSAASVVYIGSERPDLVERVVLSGPFVRDHEMTFGLKALIWIGFRGFWGAGLWSDYYKDLHTGVKPIDLEEHSKSLEENLNEEGRLKILRNYLFSTKKGCEEKLVSIKVPVEIVMGGKDPDFEDPLLEAEWIGKTTGGKVHVFDEAGHYPHREEPKRFAEILR